MKTFNSSYTEIHIQDDSITSTKEEKTVYDRNGGMVHRGYDK